MTGSSHSGTASDVTVTGCQRELAAVLKTLQDPTISVPFPYVSKARAVIDNVITAIRGVNDNKCAFQQLAQDVYEVASMVASTLQRAAEHCKRECAQNAEVNEELQTLTSTLNEISRFARKRSLISRIRRVVSTFKSDGSRIREYRERLKHTFDKFESAMVPCAACHQESMPETLDIANTAPQTQTVISEQLRSTSHLCTAPENATSRPQRSSQSQVVYNFNNDGDATVNHYHYANPGGISRYHAKR
ncbi:hypothetical protein K435DRAFT_844596 [Dendrothele bispora CBS 962.96]|uniref:NACHT-NTPase and P-loop NTPases N-terminal domain-containing protein n=1 Tax=Dendrothele bispora (strain CBS 962.96) TaxID=1314807 RepID=A0A4S8L0N8_DENBC|nr:hypothetical protein K435DRAFT_844596 [Dendrothele bispora CBS 962.96]